MRIYRGMCIVKAMRFLLHYPPRSGMPKKEKKRLQVVISEEQDALLTRAAYALSSPERLVSKSEVVRLAIAKIVQELEQGKEELAELLKRLEPEEETS
jgi:hypothetical protein